MSPFVNFKSNAEIAQDERVQAEAEDRALAEEARKNLITSGLAGHLRTLWEKAQRAKIPYEDRMVEAKRARNSEYHPKKLAAIKAMLGEDYDPIYMRLTETKCRAAESWVRDILLPPDDTPWDIEPTPIPELPPAIEEEIYNVAQASVIQQAALLTATQGIQPNISNIQLAVEAMIPMLKAMVDSEIKEAARKAAEKMRETIKDNFAEGNWEKELEKSIYDVVTYGTAIFKGPVVENKKVRIRDLDRFSGNWITRIEDKHVATHKRVNPFDFYPSPDATKDCIPWAFHKIRYTRKDLSDLLSIEGGGYDKEAIREVLKEHSRRGFREMTVIDQEKADLEGRDSFSIWETENVDGLEFRGSAPGSLLREFGIDVTDDAVEYNVICHMIDRWVIKAVINPDPLGEKYLFAAGFSEDPDSFWHKGVPDLLSSIQGLANACARAIVQNVGIASGPQVEVSVDRLAPGENVNVFPWKVWKSTSKGMMESNAVRFYQPEMVTRQLVELYNFCLEVADDDSGVPRYSHTGETRGSGAGETSSGLQMLMSHAARGIKNVVRNMSTGIVEPSVRSQYHYNMFYEEADPEIIGDLRVVAKGSNAILQKEQMTIRRREVLAETNNPNDLAIMGLKGRAELLRKNLEGLGVDPNKVIEDEENLTMMQNQMMLGPGQAPPESPAELDAAGSPVAGRDFGMNETPKGTTP